MIKFINLSDETPYQKFKEFYHEALNKNQSCIEAVAISSFNSEADEVDSRFVNLKYIAKDEWIFFFKL